MKLTMLRVSVPVLMLSLFQSGYGTGISFSELSEVATLAAQGEVVKAAERLYEYTGGNVSVYDADAVPEEVKAVVGLLEPGEVEEYRTSALEIIRDNVPDVYKDSEEYRTRFLEILMGKVDKNMDLEQIPDEFIASVINDHKDYLVSNFYEEAYFKESKDIKSDLASWRDNILGKWGESGFEKKLRLSIVIPGKVEFDATGEDSTNLDTWVEYIDNHSSTRYDGIVGGLYYYLKERVITPGTRDQKNLLKEYLIAEFIRDMVNYKHVDKISEAILAKSPANEEVLEKVTLEEFGKHFADFIGSSSAAPAGFDWDSWREGVDEAVADPSKREEAVKDFFKPLSKGDATNLIEKLILIKRNTK